MRRTLFLPLLFVPFSLIAQIGAQRYRSIGDDGRIVVSLAERTDRSITGVLIIDDAQYPITARYDGDRIVGSVRTTHYDLYLEATPQPGTLTLILMDLDRTGQPRPATAQRFYLQSDIDAPPRDHGEAPTPSTGGTRPPRMIPSYPPGAGPLGAGYSLDPMLGRFSDGYVHLDLNGANGRYDGSLTITGVTYPVQLTRNRGGEFEGGYWIGGVEYPLVIALTSNGVSAVLDGQLRVLPRVTPPTAGYRTGSPLPGGRTAYGPDPRLPNPGPVPFNDAYLIEWFSGKAIYFPDPLARPNAGGIVSRRVLHLCYAGELEIEDRDTVPQPSLPGRRAGHEPTWLAGTWLLLWDDITLDLEANFNGRTERYELTFTDAGVQANAETVLIGYSDRCR